VNRVTLDTNIYVSAFEFGGGPMRLLQMGMDGEVEVKGGQPGMRCVMEPQTKHIDPFVAFLDSILPLNQKIAQFGAVPFLASFSSPV
jgi:hypothetical protein